MTIAEPAADAAGGQGGGNPFERVVRVVDGWQQRRRSPAFVFGVVKKFGDDRAGSLAALIAYYGFLAVFPLLLAMTTVLGFVFSRNESVRSRLLTSALRDFPIIGTQLGEAIQPLKGNGVGLTVGLLGLLWGGLGVTQVGQHAMAQVWNVPGAVRPNFVKRMARGLGLLAVLGLGVIVTSVLASLPVLTDAAAPARAAAAVATLGLNMVLYMAAFRVMTPRQVQTRHLVPGALIGGVAWSALQAFGGYLVNRQLRHAGDVYGFFASVLGLVSWLYLAAQISLYAAEVNVVRARRLWPRSILQPPLTPADQQTLSDIARQEERRPEQTVAVSFDQPAEMAEVTSVQGDGRPVAAERGAEPE